MALSRIKTWIAGETLTAADLNAEFNNLIDNASSLISPLTASLDANGNIIILDADGDTTITSDTDDRIDFALSGTDLFRMDGTATTPVNGLTLIARATGSKPSLQALTSDANEGLDIRDDNGNEILILSSVASAANEITITAAAAGSEPSIAATGDDTDIDITLTPKGTGGVTVSTGDVTVSSGDVTVTSTDAGAAGGPKLVLDRNSASPAANDVIGGQVYRGRDSAANSTDYVTTRAQIVDPTSGSEDSSYQIFTLVGGSVGKRLDIRNGIFTPNATGGDQGADTINASGFYKDGVGLNPITLDTLVDATNGGANDLTAIDFTGIPSGVKRVKVLLDQVSLSGTDNILVQMGDSGGIEATGYAGSLGRQINTTGDSDAWGGSGIEIYMATATRAVSAVISLELVDASTNLWVIGFTAGWTNTSGAQWGGGSKTLSATLDRVRIKTSGTDTFDNGNVNISYE